MIRQGRTLEAKNLLENMNPNDLSQKSVARYANLARRAGAIELSLRILKPYVRGLKSREEHGSDEQKAEYAASLTLVGAVDEALELLGKVNLTTCPKATLYLVFAMFKKWQYREAIPLLLKVANSSQLDEYQKLTVRMNLAACNVVCENFSEAENDLLGVEEQTQKNGWSLLKDQLNELRLQIKLGKQDYSRANDFIHQMMPTELNERHKFLIKKRLFFLKCLAENKKIQREEFSEFRRMAYDFSDWDSLRDSDFYEGTIFKDINLLKKVYFGSPFRRYREWVQTTASLHNMEIGDSAYWSYPFDDKSRKYTLCLADGTISNHSYQFVPGQILHRVLCLLAEDFYRPCPTGELFRLLFPEEYFDFESSPNRVHGILFRLREVVEQEGFGVSLLEKTRGFKLMLGNNFAIHIDHGFNSQAFRNRDLYLLSVLYQKIKQDSFETAEACSILDLKRSRVQFILSLGMTQEILLKTGTGRYTQYRFLRDPLVI